MRLAPALLLAAALATAALLGAGVAAESASASVGPVPPAVRAYVTGGGLVDRLGEDEELADLTPGPISRVFRWTDARTAGEVDGKPVRMANEWAVPVTVAERPVGVAIVWLDLDSGQPELVELVPDAEAAAALAAVPDDAELVRDVGSGAWFALADDTATPLAAGDSGVTAPTPVDELELVAPPGDPGAAPGVADAGPGVGAWLAAASVLLAVAATLVAVRRADTL